MTDSDSRPTSSSTAPAGGGSTTGTGAPAPSDRNSLTVGPDGPILLHDHHLVEQMAHFNRERVPERNVHAKGSGAFGRFEVTGDITRYTSAAVFRPGTNTRVLARFSTVAGEMGSPDTWRDPRGFALKFYTDEGNWDLVGNNTPVFFIRDAMKFPHFIRSQKRRGASGLRDNDMQWDFWTLNPESAHQVTWLMGDRGIPASWRHMNGYGSHTYMLYSGAEKSWVKFHFISDQGVSSLTQEEANRIAGEDSDFHRRDLFQAIERGEHPSWALKVQVMPYEDAKTYRFNPFDLTKVWPHADYPLIEVGRLTLDENPANHFAEIEQAAFEPSAIVPGIGFSPDKMLLGRVFAYADTHRHRIGANYQQLPVNRHRVEGAYTYQFDGPMAYEHAGDAPKYAPNSYGAPYSDLTGPAEDGWEIDGEMMRNAYTLRPDDDDFGQPGTMVREVFDDAARERFVQNVAGHLRGGVSEPILERAFAYWRNVDAGIGARIERAVRGDAGEDVAPHPTEAEQPV